jgi:hypothetical protein
LCACTKPKKNSKRISKILFRFRIFVWNLKGSSPGYRFGNIPIFLECSSLIRIINQRKKY